MSKQFEVVAVTGKYTDKDGNEKSRYMTIGAVIQTKNGLMLKLEGVPVGWDGWAYLNEPQPKEQRTHSQMKRGGMAQARQAYGRDDDEGGSPPF
jgi:hypothetical protein